MSEKNASMDRILKLVDQDSFIEIGRQITRRSTDFPSSVPEAEGDGVHTGYAFIQGKPVYVYSQDAEVLGGSMGEMHAEKIASLYRRARSTGYPVIGMIDSSGLRLEEVTDGLNGFGQILKAKADASGVVPEIDLIFGRAGGAMGVVSGLSDFVLMEESNGRLFLNAPNAVEEVKPGVENPAKAAFQARESGIVDFTGDQDAILNICRTLIGLLPCNYEEEVLSDSSDDLNRLTPELEGVMDVRFIASVLGDQGSFLELKASYEPSAMTAFIQMDGMTVAVIGNAAETLTAGGLEKMAGFVRFADAFSIPVLSLVKGECFEATLEQEKRALKSAASFLFAITNATVPKIQILLGQPTGTAYLVMGSKAMGADYVFAMDDAKIRVMAPEPAAKILGGDDLRETAERFDDLQSASQAAKRGYVDEITDAVSLRKKVLCVLGMLITKRSKAPEPKHTAK